MCWRRRRADLLYIGRLQLKGFKSFGGSHDLILSPGFTAIVGPNGSGKSNLLDALRWALGDSSSVRLRISRQSDLLFQGSASQPPAKEGEVTLQLREEERSCVIKRRVIAPDGNTVLMIDNARKTLAELDDVKRDWKLEGSRFAFIGQGEVAEVIQQRPLARRMHLEALFGIDFYRKRRTEAAERLVTVREEYDRLRNFMAELSARREEIAPEVKRAAQLREILDTIEDDRKLLYWLRRAKAETELEQMSQAAANEAEKRDSAERWAGIWSRAVAMLEDKLSKMLREREMQNRELEQCKNNYETYTKSGYASATVLMSANARLKQAREEAERNKNNIERLKSELKKTSEENKEAAAALERSQKELEGAEKKWREFNELIEREKKQRSEWNREKGRLEAELEQIRARLSFLGKDLYELKTDKKREPGENTDLTAQIKEAAKIRDGLLAEQNELVARHGELFAKCQTLAQQLQRARREASSARSKLNEITDAIQAELYPRPVQFLLSAAKLGRVDASPCAVVDAFTCDTSLSSALEAYLGGRQFQLLVEDLEEAGRCIDQLKANSAGRATFLPLERCRPRYPDKGFRLPSKGVVGWAIDLIKVDPHWRPAIEQIMGDVLIVENYAVGQSVVRSGFRAPVATLEGDVFQPGGTVSGGRSARTGKTIEMKAQVARLEKEAAAAAKASEILNKEFKSAEASELEVAAKKEELIKKIREMDGRVAVLTDQKEQAAREERRLAGERERILASLKDEGAKYKETLDAIARLEEKWDMPTEVLDDHKLIEERERLRAAAAVATERVRSGYAMVERVSAELRTEENKKFSIEEEIAELDQRCVRERANLARVGKGCLEIHEHKKRLLAEIDKQIKGYSDFEAQCGEMKSRASAAQNRVREENESFRLFKTKIEATERELGELVNTWEEQYPYPGVHALPEDADLDELRRRIRDGDRKIKSFGEVDMGVLSEDRNLRDRLAFLGEQLDDVRSSATELEKLIADADGKAHKVFTDALAEVDERFCSLFRRLFGGGEAHLVMIEGDTIWDTGVDVVARPPGKRPKSIYQLSGGEQSLSAISLLFASMEAAGCPLAVLDEVDAALDEVNLRRFSELAKEYAQDRQILAMTHRRITMERADVLYGVTLSEEGLSQVIGVDLEEWS
jgi:chromosome segregation protein